MFRSMTERDRKKYGYVIDFNPNRIIQAIYSLNINIKSDKSYLYDIIGNIIDIDPDYFQQDDRTIDVINHFNNLYNLTFRDIPSHQRLRIFFEELNFEIPDNLETIHMHENRLDIKETGLVCRKKLIESKSKEENKNEKNKNLEKKIKEKNKEIKEQQDKLSEEQKQKLLYEVIFYYINLLIVLNKNNKYISIINMIDNIMNEKNLEKNVNSKIKIAFNTKIPLTDLNKIIINNSFRIQNYVWQLKNEIKSVKNGLGKKKMF